MIELPDLPYPQDALEPHISERTIEFHYGKHHKGYVDNLNKLIKDTDYENMDLEEIVEKSAQAVLNNAAQALNHKFFWECLTPEKTEPDDKLMRAIEKKFGSFDEFKDKFREKALKIFGSGWCWLTRDDEYIQIETTRNAGRPGDRPLLVCDVWEHAYYLDYQNDRSKYITAFFKVVNWTVVSNNFNRA